MARRDTSRNLDKDFVIAKKIRKPWLKDLRSVQFQTHALEREREILGSEANFEGSFIKIRRWLQSEDVQKDI